MKWPWPSCSNQTRTHSFRDTCPPNPAEPEGLSAVGFGDEPTDAMIRGLRSSERLFFDPKDATSPSLAPPARTETASFCLVEVESKDPVADFLGSMEEMVEAHGPLGRAGLGDMLRWYLKVNGAHNHSYVVGAFVDLLVGLAVNAATTDDGVETTSRGRGSPVSALSFYTSSSESSSTSSAGLS